MLVAAVVDAVVVAVAVAVANDDGDDDVADAEFCVPSLWEWRADVVVS